MRTTSSKYGDSTMMKRPESQVPVHKVRWANEVRVNDGDIDEHMNGTPVLLLSCFY